MQKGVGSSASVDGLSLESWNHVNLDCYYYTLILKRSPFDKSTSCSMFMEKNARFGASWFTKLKCPSEGIFTAGNL